MTQSSNSVSVIESGEEIFKMTGMSLRDAARSIERMVLANTPRARVACRRWLSDVTFSIRFYQQEGAGYWSVEFAVAS